MKFKPPHQEKGEQQRFNKTFDRDYSFVFSDDINKWMGNKRVRTPKQKIQTDNTGASDRMKLYHKRMPAIGSQTK